MLAGLRGLPGPPPRDPTVGLGRQPGGTDSLATIGGSVSGEASLRRSVCRIASCKRPPLLSFTRSLDFRKVPARMGCRFGEVAGRGGSQTQAKARGVSASVAGTKVVKKVGHLHRTTREEGDLAISRLPHGITGFAGAGAPGAAEEESEISAKSPEVSAE